jgi:hypothetical protein
MTTTTEQLSKDPLFLRGDRVKKRSGSQWHGVVVGEYSTPLTPEGYCVMSERETNAVQLYPAAALQRMAPGEK